LIRGETLSLRCDTNFTGTAINLRRHMIEI
jgi:hypothetical protein